WIADVTGTASGSGRKIVERPEKERRRVALLGLDGDAAERAADDLRASGTKALAAKDDVTDRGVFDEAIDRVRNELGPIRILVTSAGLEEFVPFPEISTAQWERILAS